MSYFPSSPSPEVAHWHGESPPHLSIQSIVERTEKAANDAIYREVREIVVTAEHTMEDICRELGIHPFHHNFFGNLIGCRLVVNSHGYLEIHRENTRYSTKFPVQFIS